MPFVRGDLYRPRAPTGVRGHEQAETRFEVVVQSDDIPMSTWVVAAAELRAVDAALMTVLGLD